MKVKWILTLLLLLAAVPACAQTLTAGEPICGTIDVTASLAEVPPMPAYTHYTLRFTPIWITPELGLVIGTGWNEAGDHVPLSGSLARIGAGWKVSLFSTLQTFDGRGYYVVSMSILAPDEGPLTAYVGSVSVSGMANDYSKPTEAPLSGVVVQMVCE